LVEVITLLAPEEVTATNLPKSGDQHTPYQATASLKDVLKIQLSPSEDVITLLTDPPADTATNKERDGDQQTADQLLCLGNELVCQEYPSVEYIAVFTTALPTATNFPREGA
jgi:hypothetical protein